MFISHPAVLSNAALFVKPIRVCVAAPHAHHCSRIESTSPGRAYRNSGYWPQLLGYQRYLGQQLPFALIRRAARALAAVAPQGSLGG
jgi:hypothetical protein